MADLADDAAGPDGMTVSPSEAAIRDQLGRILASPQFAASDGARRLLRFVVGETLAGRADTLKEYTLATEVFGRDGSFDPKLSPAVRVEAGRLRQRLERYYLTLGRDDPVLIELPRGGYVPRFASSSDVLHLRDHLAEVTRELDASAGDLLSAVQTDWYWRIPAIRLADAHATAADAHATAADSHAKGAAATYMYEFAWRSPQFDGRLGACHAMEIPFVFDTFGSDTELLWGPDPPQRLADAMHAAWVAFATTGDPGWPKYDLSRRATMRFDTTSEVVDDPRSAERALWEGVR